MRRRLLCLVLAALLPLSVTSLLSPATASSPGVTCGTTLPSMASSAAHTRDHRARLGRSPHVRNAHKGGGGASSRGERQYLLFNYASAATAWPDDPRICQCLARCIQNVSSATVIAAAMESVYLVAHSMGGLAVRFALGGRTVNRRPV